MRPNTPAALGSAVEDGQLWIDEVLVAEGAHEQCALHYEQLADQVEAQVAVVAAAESLPGFGGFASGAALRTGFEGKAAEAIAALNAYAANARALAHTFRAAAAAYQNTDDSLAGALVGTAGTAEAPHA